MEIGQARDRRLSGRQWMEGSPSVEERWKGDLELIIRTGPLRCVGGEQNDCRFVGLKPCRLLREYKLEAEWCIRGERREGVWV